MSKKQQRKCVSRSATLTIPELEQSEAAVLNTLASAHSQRSYKYPSKGSSPGLRRLPKMDRLCSPSHRLRGFEFSSS